MGAADTARLIASLELGKDSLSPALSKTDALLGKVGLSTRKAATLIGGSLAGAFGALSVGAKESQDAQAAFQSATGASAEEAKKFGSAVNGLAGESLQSFGSIADAMTTVRTDMGLTGDEATQMTQRMLKFSDATGIDATSSVKAFDDTMDAFGLSADKVQGVMDQLVASHQKYGGSIEQNQQALNDLAPQLSALNLTLDDGLGLLNLFAASGLDAASGQRALNSAVSALPKGTNMKDFIARLQGIEDPTKRATEAIKVFGSRAGVGLANALAPGKGAFEDYIITAGEASGATEKAAAAIEGTFGAQFQILMNKAGTAVRGFGSDFGPALTGIAAVASGVGGLASALHLDDVFRGALDKAAGSGIVKAASAKVGIAIAASIATSQAFASTIATSVGSGLNTLASSPIVTRAGTLMGSRFGLAFGIAALGAAGLAFAASGVETVDDVKEWAKRQAPGFKEAGEDAGGAIGQGVGDGVTKAMTTTTDWLHDTVPEAIGGVIERTVDAIRTKGPGMAAESGKVFNQIPVDAKFALGLIPDLFDDLRRDVDRKSREAGATLIANWRTSWEGVAKVEQGFFPEVVKTAGNIGKAAGIAMPHQMAVGISAARAEPLDAFNSLVEQLKTPLSATKETARLIGELTSKELAAGLVSGDPDIRNNARHVRDLILDRLGEIKPRAGTLSKDAMEALAAGMRSKDPVISAASRHIVALLPASSKMFDAGHTAGEKWVDGLALSLQDPNGVIDTALSRIGRRLIPHSPIPEGPLRGIEAAGGQVMAAWLASAANALDASRLTPSLTALRGDVLPRHPGGSNPITINVEPPAISVSARDIVGGPTEHRRYGPTPHEAGAR